MHGRCTAGAGAFTVIAAILPMAFVSGMMGPYMRPIPVGASVAMLASLGVAFIVTPWLAFKLLKGHVGVAGVSREPREPLRVIVIGVEGEFHCQGPSTLML